MLKEAVDYLDLSPGKTIVDATIGTGGHSEEIIKEILPRGRLIGIDRDEESLGIAKVRLSDYKDSCEFVYGNFSDLDSILKNLSIKRVDGILLDLGISSYQLSNAQRGFSFQADGPLDMRLDRNSYISAYDLVNNLNEDEISSLLWTFGQERFANRIAHQLVAERQRHAIATTTDLSDIIVKAVPYKYRYYRIHPATRTFQAVRIAVNRELEALEIALEKSVGLLGEEARMSVIAFHSLEDRIVKFSFRKFAASGLVEILTKKPLEPTDEEAAANPRSRSAKLRAVRRI
jgi:16S rRNA (cytosine1402-N4)-methyltransferase